MSRYLRHPTADCKTLTKANNWSFLISAGGSSQYFGTPYLCRSQLHPRCPTALSMNSPQMLERSLYEESTGTSSSDTTGSSKGESQSSSLNTSVHSSPRSSSPYPDVISGTSWPPSLKQHDLQIPLLKNDFPKLPANETPLKVADADAQTPDNWVNRNPSLVRLTGKHPFNAEARLVDLFSAGWLTPAHLHFVRNHGAVPRVNEEMLQSWTIRIHGLIENEVSFSIQDLKDKFAVVTFPVTLVCAGNRRKEQNVVRKSLGFSWGAGGVSTALWTGVYLSDVLEHVRPLKGKAKHVIFEGGDSLPNGPYGTSQRLSWAADKQKGMLIAWAMNGLPLEPDHGFPVRVIIPGQIGGRSVKWLRGIEISANESQHHLHYWDNKVLPRHLAPEVARDEKPWWYDPRYIITELNVNSAIAKPDHNEILDVLPLDLEDNSSKVYIIQGYAYSGGGRRVTRCEVTLDEGATWMLADVTYPEDQYRQSIYRDDIYGTIDLTERDTCFCWCFWSLEVPIFKLAKADVIQVCAMDEAMNMQPIEIYLNATSMMNNWQFRVAINRKAAPEIPGGMRLQFEHPTLAGTAAGGWMERLKSNGMDITRPQFSEKAVERRVDTKNREIAPETTMVKAGVDRKITPEELAIQDRTKPWFVVNSEVYDGTGFLKDHPGGGDSILLVAGQDATEDFIAIHSADARAQLAEFHIGTLSGKVIQDASTNTNEQANSNALFLDANKWKKVKLVDVKKVNHDSSIFRFALSEVEQHLGLPVGQHVFVRLMRKDTHEIVQRAYTPISKENELGFIDLLIKLYLPNERFKLGGKMSLGFDQLRIGDEIELKGPLGSFIWKGQGTALWRGQPRRVKRIGMIAAGSGITPIFQVLRSILHDEADQQTNVSLICSNSTEADILLRHELDEMFALCDSQRFSLYHTLSKGPTQDQKKFGSGRINDVMLRVHLPEPSEDSLVLVCGPKAMIDDAVIPGLQRLGWNIEKSLVIF